MNKKHKTKEGDLMFISEMEDTHLMNYILLALKGIEAIKAKLRADSVPTDKFEAAMYQEEDIYNEEDLTEMLNQLCDNLYPYMAELLLRDTNMTIRGIDIKMKLQEVFERKGAKNRITANTEFKLLAENIADGDFGWE